MFKSIRQSMAWLHSWLGLLFGWFMFVIFLTGTTAYYKDQLDLWTEPQLAKIEYQQETAIKTAYTYLQENADNADEWYINVATPNKPVNDVFWFGADGFNQALLNPNTADELLLDNQVSLGQFLYLFHFQLHGLDITTARLFASFIAFMMLITILSGIITHKKIFTDFFTFRTFKSQRSWLDFHNLSGVIALPFFIMISFTGLALLFYLYLPQGINRLYNNDSNSYFLEIKDNIALMQHDANPQPAEMKDIDFFLKEVKKTWGNAQISKVVLMFPNRSDAMISFEQAKDNTITLSPSRLEFNAITGELTPNTKNTSLLAKTNAGIYGLHLAPFAQPLLRSAFFFSGILGCLMIASGLLLWSLKRQLQLKNDYEPVGYFFVDRLNIGILVGLPLAIIASFYAVRLNSLVDIMNISFIYTFFVFWIFSFLASLLTPKDKLWISQLALLTFLCFALPIVDLIYLIQQQHISNLNQYWLFLRVDIYFILFGLFALFLMIYIRPIQDKVEQKMMQKIQTTPSQEEQSAISSKPQQGEI